MPRSSWTPADPPEPHQIGSFVLASSSLTLSPSALQCFHCYQLSRLYQVFRECGLPCGLRGSLCTLQLFRSTFFPVSSITATLDMSGWLHLAQQGLSPYKKCQAFLAHQRLREALGELAFHAASKNTKRCPIPIFRTAYPKSLLRGVSTPSAFKCFILGRDRF